MATLPTVALSGLDMLAGVICESKHVVAAHPYHFLALSVLFLLPLSSLVVAAPSLTTFSPHSLPPPHSLLCHSFPFPSAVEASLALSLAYATASLLVALSAAIAVASSVRCGFFGRPVKLLPALRFLPAPLAQLLLTLLASLLPCPTRPPPPHPPRLPPPPRHHPPPPLFLSRPKSKNFELV